jgi:hypothetical protein
MFGATQNQDQALSRVLRLEGVRRVEKYPVPPFSCPPERAFVFKGGALQGKGVFILRTDGRLDREAAILDEIKQIADGRSMALEREHFTAFEKVRERGGIVCFFGVSPAIQVASYSLSISTESSHDWNRRIWDIGTIQVKSDADFGLITQDLHNVGFTVTSSKLC